MKKIPGKITGPVVYTGKTGITLNPKSQIKLNGELAPLGNDVAHSLCFFFNFHFYEDLGDNYVLFRRGKPGEMHSFVVTLKKSSKGRFMSLEVNYDFKGKMDKITYEN